MATSIIAGNATNGLTLTPDNTGAFELKTGTGSGTTALTLDSSQNATVAGTLKAAGITTAMYPLVSGTAWTYSTGVTSVDFTGIPSWVKRITVMLNALSTNGAGTYLTQLGSGSFQTTGYAGYSSRQSNAGNSYSALSSGFISSGSAATTTTFYGTITLTNINSNTWVGTVMVTDTSLTNNLINTVGSVTLSGTLDRLRLYVDGTQQFDAGTINILYE